MILLHGFPGNERNLDSPQALRRAGMNVLFFDYRFWEAEEPLPFQRAPGCCLGRALYIRLYSFSVAAFKIDPVASWCPQHGLAGSDATPRLTPTISCSVALDFWNVGADGVHMKQDARSTSTATAISRVTAPGAPIGRSQLCGERTGGRAAECGTVWLVAERVFAARHQHDEERVPLLACCGRLHSGHAQHLTTSRDRRMRWSEKP